MKLVVGLGNIGTTYDGTRHNAGFDVVDRVTHGMDAVWSTAEKHHCRVAKAHADGETFLFAKPTTFMNASGNAVQSLLSFYHLDPTQDLLVVHDEMDLPPGRIAFASGSGPAGHNGIIDIQNRIGKQFPRLRIGIGRPAPPIPKEDWVLSRPTDKDLHEINEAILRASHAVTTWLHEGTTRAMNTWNIKPPVS